MPVWEEFARVTDQFVDGLFGEQVKLRPYTTPSMSTASPDASRPVTDAVGIQETMRTNSSQVGGMTTRMVEADLLLSIRKESVEACGLTKGDRVEFVERGSVMYEVTQVEPEATDRPRVHLVRIKGE